MRNRFQLLDSDWINEPPESPAKEETQGVLRKAFDALDALPPITGPAYDLYSEVPFQEIGGWEET